MTFRGWAVYCGPTMGAGNAGHDASCPYERDNSHPRSLARTRAGSQGIGKCAEMLATGGHIGPPLRGIGRGRDPWGGGEIGPHPRFRSASAVEGNTYGVAWWTLGR